MNNTVAANCWCLIVNLHEGEHEYKFLVDGVWRHSPKDRTVGGEDAEPMVAAVDCSLRNVIEVRRSDFEVFEALDNDCKDVNDAKMRSRNNSIRQQQRPTAQEYVKLVMTFMDSTAFTLIGRHRKYMRTHLENIVLNERCISISPHCLCYFPDCLWLASCYSRFQTVCAFSLLSVHFL
jgi:hypothetical protein